MTSQLGQLVQTSERTDWAAEDSDHENFSKPALKKALIKQITIREAMDDSKSFVILPTLRKAIPEAVAKSHFIPKRSIDYQVQLQLDNTIKSSRVSSRMPQHAFGRSFAKGHALPVIDDNIQPLVPNFPQDIRTKRSVFQGIGHLQTTRMFVQFLEENPNISKPAYLVDNHMFNGEEKPTEYLPLYAHIVNNNLNKYIFDQKK